MADQDQTTADFPEHPGADLAREGAGVFPVSILRRQLYSAPPDRSGDLAQDLRLSCGYLDPNVCSHTLLPEQLGYDRGIKMAVT